MRTKESLFFIALEAEIVKAKMYSKSVIIEMDANAKLGSQYIPKDTHEMLANERF